MGPGRPKKPRIVQRKPLIKQFSPRGRIGRPGEVALGLDEYEAMRLADFIGLDQKNAATSMGVSRQTYGRVLKRARRAIAAGIILGKTITIKSPTK